MRLSSTDWIQIGPGRLYGAPFVSRCLIYRIYDNDCSLLIFHEPHVSAAAHTDRKTGAFVTEAVVKEPDVVYVYFAPSAKTPLSRLIKLPPRLLRLSDTSSLQQSFSDITLHLESHKLPIRGAYIVRSAGSRRHAYQVANTHYWVQGRVQVMNLGKVMPPTAELWSRCWKVSVGNTGMNGDYDLSSSRSWSLTALDVDDVWQPRLELSLKRMGEYRNQ